MVFGFGKKYKCDTCGAKFSTESQLKEHAKTHMRLAQQSASPTQVQQFKCQTCGASFNSQAELMEHAKRAHPM